ncbi:VanZ family protein [bacterium]|nr:VanZ family protein [bacterium]
MDSNKASGSLKPEYFYPLIIWITVIFISSSIEGTSLPLPDVWSLDKFIHTGVFAVLAFCSLRAFTHYGYVRNKSIIWIIGWSLFFCLIYAASDEFHQSFVRGRYASAPDFFADSIGVAAVHLYYYFRKFRIKPE